MCCNHNVTASGIVPTPEEFAGPRLDMSGMEHTIMLADFVGGQLARPGADLPEPAATRLAHAQHLCAMIGALSNDVFSFEREFILEGCDANAIVVHLLNEPDQSVHQAVRAVIAQNRALVRQFLVTLDTLMPPTAAIAAGKRVDTALTSRVDTLRAIFRACWAWQRDSPRYQSKTTILTRLPVSSR